MLLSSAMDPTDLVIEHPWLAPVGWTLLHSLDYFLTIVGAKVRLRGAHNIIRVDGSYELNPFFEKVIDRQRWFSTRFLITLVGIALALYFIASTCPDQDMARGLGFLLGVILFTRIAVIGRHLHNIWLYSRIIRHPESMTGSIRYTRPTVYSITAATYLHYALLLAGAAAIAPNPWIIGGSVGNGFIASYSAILGWKASRRPVSSDVSTRKSQKN